MTRWTSRRVLEAVAISAASFVVGCARTGLDVDGASLDGDGAGSGTGPGMGGTHSGGGHPGTGGAIGAAGGSGGARSSGGAGHGGAVCGAGWSLGNPVQFAAPPGSQEAFIDDIDGDGRDDVIVASPGAVAVYLRTDNGQLGSGQEYETGLSGLQPGQSSVLGDFDGSGEPDFLVGGFTDVVWLPNDGAGAFLGPRKLLADPRQTGGVPFGRMRLTDVDGDGALDLTRVAGTDVRVVTWYGDGHGGVRDVGTATAGWPLNDVTFTDVNGDDRLDAVGVTEHGDVVAFEQEAGDRYSQPRTLATGVVGIVPFGVEAGDVDDDGKPDLVVTGGGNNPVSIAVLHRQDGFTAVQHLETYDIPETVRIADLDGNGAEDVIVLHGGWDAVGVYLQCAGQLLPERLFEIPYATAYAHDALAIGDLDGDGCNDIAIADYNWGLNILHGRGCARR